MFWFVIKSVCEITMNPTYNVVSPVPCYPMYGIYGRIFGGEHIGVEYDDSIIFEYNAYQNKIRYPLKYNLKKGTHTMYVQASDRVGNRSIVKGDFYIK